MGRHEVGQLLRHAPSTFCEGAKLRAFLRLGALALVVIDALVSGAYAQDISGAADHPLVPRYEGAEIVLYDVQAFTSYPLLTAPAVAYGGIAANPEATLPLEGRTTRISYRAPADRSVLEVFRNYQQALAEAGFEPIFTCAREACGGRNFNAALATSSLYTLFGEYHAEQHYFAGRLQRPEGDVFVALYTVMNKAGGGPNRDRVMAQLDVVEVQPMEEHGGAGRRHDGA